MFRYVYKDMVRDLFVGGVIIGVLIGAGIAGVIWLCLWL
jgi:hypothetical protein